MINIIKDKDTISENLFSLFKEQELNAYLYFELYGQVLRGIWEIEEVINSGGHDNNMRLYVQEIIKRVYNENEMLSNLYH